MSETNLTDLSWYETLRLILEPYKPPGADGEFDQQFSSAEIISSIEQHHGVPQGPVGKEINILVHWNDFVAVMHRLGYREVNAGGVQLAWLMKKK